MGGSDDNTGVDEPVVDVAVLVANETAGLPCKAALPLDESAGISELVAITKRGRDDPDPDRNTESVKVDVVPVTVVVDGCERPE